MRTYMLLDMDFQPARPAVRFTTVSVVAHERLLSIVGQLMSLHMSFRNERDIALGALERPLTGLFN